MFSFVASPTVPMMGLAKLAGRGKHLASLDGERSRDGTDLGAERHVRRIHAQHDGWNESAAACSSHLRRVRLRVDLDQLSRAGLPTTLAVSPLTFDLSIPIRNTARTTTMGSPSSPSSSPRSGWRRRCDSRFVPSS